MRETKIFITASHILMLKAHKSKSCNIRSGVLSNDHNERILVSPMLDLEELILCKGNKNSLQLPTGVQLPTFWAALYQDGSCHSKWVMGGTIFKACSLIFILAQPHLMTRRQSWYVSANVSLVLLPYLSYSCKFSHGTGAGKQILGLLVAAMLTSLWRPKGIFSHGSSPRVAFSPKVQRSLDSASSHLCFWDANSWVLHLQRLRCLRISSLCHTFPHSPLLLQ
jgi:hypothetical protein